MYAPTCIVNKNWTCREIYRTGLTIDVIYVAIFTATHVRMMVMIVVNDGDDDCDGGEGNGECDNDFADDDDESCIPNG